MSALLTPFFHWRIVLWPENKFQPNSASVLASAEALAEFEFRNSASVEFEKVKFGATLVVVYIEQ